MSTTSSISSTSSMATTYTNPNGVLKSEDFLHLLLTELENQDPTSPMDTAAMLTQTSQLSQLDASTSLKTSLDSLTKTLSVSQTYTIAGAIGHLASTGETSLAHTKGTNTEFSLYFPTAISEAEINIVDSKGTTVRSMTMSGQAAGLHAFTWDGKDSAGNTLDTDSYTVKTNYTDTSGNYYSVQLGTYPIESVKMGSKEPQVQIGGKYVAMSALTEIY